MNTLPHEPQTIRLKVRIAETDHILGTLSFNVKENQLYYLMPWSKDSSTTPLEDQTTDPIAKISFHKNVTHLKIQKLPKLNPIKKIFLPKEGEVKLLYVESFILNGDPSILPAVENFRDNLKPNRERTIANFSDAANFSLILLLAPHNHQPEDVLLNSFVISNNSEVRLLDFHTAGDVIGKIIAFDGYDLIFFVSRYWYQLTPTQSPVPTGPLRIFNYEKPEQLLAHMIKSSNIVIGDVT